MCGSRGHRCVLAQEPLRLQLDHRSARSTRGRARRSSDLLRRPRAETDADDGRVREREGDRRCRQCRPVALADRGDRPRPLDDLRRCIAVVVAPAAGRLPLGEKAAVEDAGGDDSDTAFLAEGKEVVEAVLLEERVPAREHHHVDVGVPHEVGEHRRLVHPGADRRHGALRAQLRERRIAGREHLVPVVVRIVEVDDVDPVEAEALQALRERASDPVAAEVPAAAVRGGNGEPVVVLSATTSTRSSARPTFVEIT